MVRLLLCLDWTHCNFFRRELTSFVLSKLSIGADDAHGFQLLGSDIKRSTVGLGRDIDSILLTELYEYIILSNPPPEVGQMVAFPHLLIYKVQRALSLADKGYITEAQKLVEAASSITKALSKSFQFNPAYLEYIESVNFRISTSEPTEGSGWFGGKLGRPKLDKIWVQSFNKFVAGDEGDQETPVDSDNTGGIFKRLASTPSNSETAASSETSPNIYGGSQAGPSFGLARAQSLSSFGPPITEATVHRNQSHIGLTGFAQQQKHQYNVQPSHYQQPTQSQFAPYYGNGVSHPAEPRTVSPLQVPSRPSSSGTERKTSSVYNPYAPQSRPGSQQGNGVRSYTSDTYAPPASNGASPYAPSHGPEGESTKGLVEQPSEISYVGGSYMPYGYYGQEPERRKETVEDIKEENEVESLETAQIWQDDFDHRDAGSDRESDETGYDPESGNGEYDREGGNGSYEPDSYKSVYKPSHDSADYYAPAPVASSGTPIPAIPGDQEEEDDHLEISNSKKKEDKKEDVKKQQQGRGWFSWLKRGEEQPNHVKVYKAKLGEELSLVYDPKLKRYVNKNATPEELKEAAATPPPPPPKSKVRSANTSAKPSPKPGTKSPVSGSGLPSDMVFDPPSGQPSTTSSRVPSAAAPPPVSSLEETAAAPSGGPPGGPPGSGAPPPSNGPETLKKAAATGGLDDLLAAAPPPSGRKGARRNARNRYVDIMNQEKS